MPSIAKLGFAIKERVHLWMSVYGHCSLNVVV